MRRRATIALLFGSLVLLPAGGVQGAPPPPPSPGVIERATKIAVPPSENGLADYVSLFAEDVLVFEGDEKVAANRNEFLAYLRNHSALHFKVLHLSYGNPILVVETVNNFPEHPLPMVVYDCCFWARVASYHLDSSGKVDRVLFLENGAYWGPPEKPE